MGRLKLIVFLLCRAIGLFHLALWITRRRLRILCYHGLALADEAAFRPKLFIKSEQFDQRLATIQRYGFDVLPLHEALKHLRSRHPKKRSVVITFDDGFHSVHRIAAPRLREYGYPATVYLTTYYVASARPVFRLVIQYMFWKTIKQEISATDIPWESAGRICLSDPGQKERAMWNCINYGEANCTEDDRSAICAELGDLLETPYEDILRSRMFHLMTPDELRSISEDGICVELHTHRHLFSDDDRALAQREITENRAAIKRWLSIDAKHFCYPSGLWNEKQWPWLDEMGVQSSVTCSPGLNSSNTPKHALRRFLDGANIHQLEFEAALTGFSDLAGQQLCRLRKLRASA